jgi:transcriptional regulator GlxA family with amidase domain
MEIVSLENRAGASTAAGDEDGRDRTTCERLPPRHAVELASEFLRDHVAEGVRMRRLSGVTGVSDRALRNAFRREHGVSPKQFDIRQRLYAARRALCDATAPHTVTTVATQYGFFELGRFARLYREAFGESPSQTLKSRAAAAREAS